MIEVENEVRRWREKVERESSLSPRELDELEDHLRARVEIEVELDPALAPARALVAVSPLPKFRSGSPLGCTPLAREIGNVVNAYRVVGRASYMSRFCRYPPRLPIKPLRSIILAS